MLIGWLTGEISTQLMASVPVLFTDWFYRWDLIDYNHLGFPSNALNISVILSLFAMLLITL